jgi:hypothetical protein
MASGKRAGETAMLELISRVTRIHSDSDAPFTPLFLLPLSSVVMAAAAAEQIEEPRSFVLLDELDVGLGMLL